MPQLLTRGQVGRALRRLEDVDWDDLADVYDKSIEAVTDLASPSCLRPLFESALEDPGLVSLSERQAWGDRIVLYDDPEHGFRIRLHNWGEAREDPHNHRWPFTAIILRGHYLHGFYGLARDLAQRLNGGPLKPASLRVERPGSTYSFDREMVHTTWTAPRTVSLMVRGPADRDYSIMLARNGSEISYKKYGAVNESQEKAASVRTSIEQLEAVLRDLRLDGIA